MRRKTWRQVPTRGSRDRPLHWHSCKGRNPTDACTRPATSPHAPSLKALYVSDAGQLQQNGCNPRCLLTEFGTHIQTSPQHSFQALLIVMKACYKGPASNTPCRQELRNSCHGEQPHPSLENCQGPASRKPLCFLRPGSPLPAPPQLLIGPSATSFSSSPVVRLAPGHHAKRPRSIHAGRATSESLPHLRPYGSGVAGGSGGRVQHELSYLLIGVFLGVGAVAVV